MAGYIGSKASVVSNGAERKKVFDITTTTTSLTGCSYTPNQVHVFHNGVRLVDGTDYTATDGSTVTLTTAAQSGDEVVVISYATFQPADAYTKTESDDRFVNDPNAVITVSGSNVGIGTGSPASQLDLYNATTAKMTVRSGDGSAASVKLVRVAENDTSTDYEVKNAGGTFKIIGDNTSQNEFSCLDIETLTTKFYTNNTERMRIDSSGNVGIGTSSPTGELTIYKSSGSVALDITRGSNRWTIGEYDNNNLLQIGGLYGSHPGIYMNSSGAALIGDNAEQLGSGTKMLCCSGHGYASLRVRRSADSGPCVGFYGYGSNSTLVGRIDVNNTSTSYITSSDYRLKENVTPLDGAADRLAQIPVHRFNFIADPDTTVDGFLAHEVQAFVPEAITGEKDGVDADGNPEYQGIDQSKLVPLLTAALQEALQKIDALEARVAALEAV